MTLRLIKHTWLFLVLFSFSFAGEQALSASPLEDWVKLQRNVAFTKMMQNISPPGTARGAVVASPSKSDPDYWYHWVRDAGIIMDVLAVRYQVARAGDETKSQLFHALDEFTDFTLLNQRTPTLSGGPGEPKYHVDGRAFNGPWGRPQNDGPALRAITLIHWANALLDEGQEAFVRRKLYDKGPAGHKSAIKFDLEFVSHKWQETCFDVWEEVNGHHFYTRMVQRRAMVEGAKLANRLGDGAASDWYSKQAKLLEREIEKHWDAGKGYIVVTLNFKGGHEYKHSGLDSAVILGVLHGDAGDGFFGVQDPRVQKTVRKQEEAFAKIYPINVKGPVGVAIGRYPEDRYDGLTGNSRGNPWFICTNAFGEYYYRLARYLRSNGKGAEVAMARGDQYLERSKFHSPADHSLSEQINRDHGFMQGARDLTWSYASLLTAIQSRR